jgi:hypothetical protein
MINHHNPRIELIQLYDFARRNKFWFAKTERFRPCGRTVAEGSPESTVGYEVSTFDMDALMRAYVQDQIKQKTNTFRALEI